MDNSNSLLQFSFGNDILNDDRLVWSASGNKGINGLPANLSGLDVDLTKINMNVENFFMNLLSNSMDEVKAKYQSNDSISNTTSPSFPASSAMMNFMNSPWLKSSPRIGESKITGKRSRDHDTEDEEVIIKGQVSNCMRDETNKYDGDRKSKTGFEEMMKDHEIYANNCSLPTSMQRKANASYYEGKFFLQHNQAVENSSNNILGELAENYTCPLVFSQSSQR